MCVHVLLHNLFFSFFLPVTRLLLVISVPLALFLIENIFSFFLWDSTLNCACFPLFPSRPPSVLCSGLARTCTVY